MADSFESMTAAQPAGDRAARQLAAMKLLFDVERDQQETDIVLATVFEALADGIKRTTDELFRQVQVDWPGVVLSRDKLELALRESADRGLLTSEVTLSGSDTWTISGVAKTSIETSRAWAEDVLVRCRRQIQDRAEERGFPTTDEQAASWTNLLLEVLHEGMIQSFTNQPEGLREVDRRLFPPYDREKISAATQARVDDAETAEFLTALALAALNPASTFGSEVVHYLATGYILYALLLGVDLASQREELEGFRGQVLLLDTPILLRLLSGGNAFQGTSDLVGRIATEAGVSVAVAPQTRQELERVLDHRADDAKRIERELIDGVPRQNLAATTTDEVLAIWLDDPKQLTWSSFRDSAGELFQTLTALGVAVDFDPEGHADAPHRRRSFADEVKRATKQRGKERAEVNAMHDGEVLCLVETVRAGRLRDDPDCFWPGCFVVTTDKSLNDAYREVTGDSGSVSLTISQAASLLARMAQPADSEQLAGLIASDLQWQARFQRAAGYGVDHAIELARSFAAKDPDALLVEAESTELTLEGLLDGVDYGGDPSAAVRAAIVKQDERRHAVSREHRSEIEAERQRESIRATKERTRADTYERLVREKDLELEAARTEATNRERDGIVRTRQGYALVGYLAVGLAVLFAVALGLASWAAFGISLLLLTLTAPWVYGWTKDPKEGFGRVLALGAAWTAGAILSAVVL